MMYTRTNYKSKAAIKRAIKAGENIAVFQPGPFGEGDVENGSVTLEGPHFPKPHTWYGTGVVKDGTLISVK